MRDAYYRRVEGGITFVFKAEPGHPELLHIFARHRTEPEDAIDTFFDEEAEDEWDARHARWETRSATRTLYWFWIVEGKVVMVVSCFWTVPHE